MRAYGQPPYKDLYAYPLVMSNYDALAGSYTPPLEYMKRGDASGVGPYNILAGEYDLVEKVNVLRGLLDTFSIMYPQLQEIDFRKDVTRLEVPIYVLDGHHELSGRRDLVFEWYNQLDAPDKHLYTFENAGHSVAFEQFEELTRIMNQTVLPETYPGK